MPFWDRLFTKAPDIIRRRFGYIGNPFLTPPERNTRGFLAAYGEIYSLFGISIRIATAVSEVKWRLYRGSERDERNQIPRHPVLHLLDYANEFQTGQEILELTQLHMDLVGKAFWYLPKNALGVPAEIWVLVPHLMKPVKDDRKFISGWVFECGMEAIPFTLDEIIPFSMPDPLNPYGGIGYAQAAAVELDSEAYAGRWNRNFFYNSARADAVLESEDSLTDEQFEKLRLQWKTEHGGVSRAHRIAILEAGLKYKQIQINQKDMDFPELRKQTRENLMFTFGMPLPVMGITENVNRANAEAGDYIFARWLVRPRLTRIKNKLNEQLIPMYPMAKNIELDFDEVVPETIEQKRQLAESGIKAGYMTVDEARKMQGFDPLPSGKGDVLLMPFNLSPMSVTEDLVAEKPPEPEKPPSPPTEQPIVEEESVKGLTEYQKEAFWRAYAFKTENQERKFAHAFKGLLEEQQTEVLDNFYEFGDASFDFDFWSARFDMVFRPLIGNIYSSAYDDVLVDIGKSMKQELNPLALEWIATRSLTLAKELNKTTTDRLRRELAEGFAEGEGTDKIARRIGGFFDQTYKGRAKAIARTEVIAASNEGALNAYEDEGILKVEFITALDERVDDECAALHGQIFPVDEAHGLIPIHTNCRCTFVPII